MREILQAGGIVFWGDHVVLRRTLAGEWIFPKGHVNQGESAEETALREVEEETGVRAEALFEAGAIRFRLGGQAHRVRLWAMRAVQVTPEWKLHQGVDAFRVPLAEALQRVSFEESRHVLEVAMQQWAPSRPVEKR